MTGSKDLIENAKSFDGTTITYDGEAVTAVMNRGDYSWVSLNDGDNAIGVWCRTSSVSSIKFIGDYKNKGDILEATGTFHRACPMHGGELDIHAETIKIMKSGTPQVESVSKVKLNLSIAVFLIILSVVIIFRKRF